MNLIQQQCYLAALGYYKLIHSDGTPAIDGIGGPATRSAIMQFQTEHRERPDGTFIFVDGIWGPQTEKAIREVIYTEEPPQVEQPDTPGLTPADLEKTIWADLSAQGFPAAAVAGIMGNLCAESALKPNNMEDQYQSKLGFTDETYTQAVDNGSYQNFVHDAVGYGLAQWTWHSRKKGLLQMARSAGKSIADPDLQIAYLMQELNGQWPGLVKQLKDPNISVYMATKKFMFSFENPYDKSDSAVAGRVRLSEIYYNRYS